MKSITVSHAHNFHKGDKVQIVGLLPKERWWQRWWRLMRGRPDPTSVEYTVIKVVNDHELLVK